MNFPRTIVKRTRTLPLQGPPGPRSSLKVASDVAPSSSTRVTSALHGRLRLKAVAAARVRSRISSACSTIAPGAKDSAACS